MGRVKVHQIPAKFGIHCLPPYTTNSSGSSGINWRFINLRFISHVTSTLSNVFILGSGIISATDVAETVITIGDSVRVAPAKGIPC